MNGLVSIIMPSYNTSRYISESIESVIAQTYKNWELIIVDDCSKDNTESVINKYLDDKRIKFYKMNKNSGAAHCRNYAISVARGRWIAFLDSDDLWSNNKLEKQLTFMVENKYYFTCASSVNIDENSKETGLRNKSIFHITKRKMIHYCWPGCLTVIYDASFVGLIQIENLKKNNDYAMWLKIVNKCDCYYLDEVLGFYRVRTNSISHDSIFRLIKAHYKLFREGESQSVVYSLWHTMINLFFGVIKKIWYKKKYVVKEEKYFEQKKEYF